jgi:hypothetical protein
MKSIKSLSTFSFFTRTFLNRKKSIESHLNLYKFLKNFENLRRFPVKRLRSHVKNADAFIKPQ